MIGIRRAATARVATRCTCMVQRRTVGTDIEIAQAAAGLYTWSLYAEDKGPGGAQYIIPLWKAAERNIGSQWDQIRGAVIRWLNTCDCVSCGDGTRARCRLKTCGVERLGYEALVKLVDRLATERAADAPAEQLTWTVPGAVDMQPGVSYTCKNIRELNDTAAGHMYSLLRLRV